MTSPLGGTEQEYMATLAGRTPGAPVPRFKTNAEIMQIVQQLGPNYDWDQLEASLQDPQTQFIGPEDYDALRGVIDEHRYQMSTGNSDFRSYLVDRVRLAPGDLEPYYRAMVERTHQQRIDDLNARSEDPNLPFTERHALRAQASDLRENILRDRYNQHSEYIGRQYLHDVSGGIFEMPDRVLSNAYAQDAHNSLLRPAIGLLAMANQGSMISGAIGLVSKIPVATVMIEGLGPKVAAVVNANYAERMVGQTVDVALESRYILGDLLSARQGAVLSGMAINAGIDAGRPEGIPEDPMMIDISGWGAKWMNEHTGMNPRAALAVAGAAQGGLLGEMIGGMAKGVELGYLRYNATRLTENEIGAMRSLLEQAGHTVAPDATKYQVARLFRSNLTKLTLPENLAGAFAERGAREEWITSQLLSGKTIIPMSEDARYVFAITNVNPGGINIAHGIQDLEAVTAAAERLNPNVQIVAVRRGATKVPEQLMVPPDEAAAMARRIGRTGFAREVGAEGQAVAGAADAAPVRIGAKGPPDTMPDTEVLENLTDKQLWQEVLDGPGEGAVRQIFERSEWRRRADEVFTKVGPWKGEQLNEAWRNAARQAVAEHDAVLGRGKYMPHTGPRPPKGPTFIEPKVEQPLEEYIIKEFGSSFPGRGAVSASEATNTRQHLSALQEEFQAQVAPALRQDGVKTVRLYRHQIPGEAVREEGVTLWTADRGIANRAQMAANKGNVIMKDVPIEDIVWGTKRNGHRQFLVRDASVETGGKIRPRVVSPRAKVVEYEVPIYDVMVVRNRIKFDEAVNLPRQQQGRIKTVEKLLEAEGKVKSDPRTLMLAPNGKLFSGTTELGEVVRRAEIPLLKVNGVYNPSISLREGTGLIVGNIDAKTGTFVFEIPNRITNEQANAMIRFAERTGPKSVRITNAAGKTVELTSPSGSQIEDALAGMSKHATKENVITPKLVEQFKKTGVFEGQAAVSANGIPYRIIRKAGALYEVENPLRPGTVVKVHPSKLRILPTTLDGPFAPSTTFMNLLDDETRQGMGRLIAAIDADLAKPVKTKADLERLAGSMGFKIGSPGKGTFSISSVTAPGEEVTVKGLDAAVEFIRKHAGPVPELTPPELTRILGESGANVGMVGVNSAISSFGERIPLDLDAVTEDLVMKARGPGILETTLKPTRALFLNMQEKTGIPFYAVFNELQTNGVRRQNFLARWALGQGDILPEGVIPLKKIMDRAKGVDGELVTEWLETPEHLRADVERRLGETGTKAAKELRKWYDAMFKEFGIEVDYIENYAPRMRKIADVHGNDMRTAWRASTGRDMPGGVEFFADSMRTGMLDVYETNAWRAAQGYLKAGASTRFMKETLDKTTEFLRLIQGNKAIHQPMFEFVEALRGFESRASKTQLEESVRTIFEGGIPGLKPEAAKSLASDFADVLLGFGYASTMAYRPAAAMRNMLQVMQTTLPVSTLDGYRFSQALGMAMTEEGKLAAINAGAINLKPQALPFRDELNQATRLLPDAASSLLDKGFRMYDTADDFTRAASFHVFKMQADDAIAAFSKGAASGAPPKKLMADLMRKSGAFMMDEPIRNEFLRRLATDPTGAANYLAKEGTDFTQFLYGRGMQPKWMRSVAGRFMGQYGTWPLWFIDYQTRMISNLAKNGTAMDVARFVGKQALVNGAVMVAGARMGVELGKWLSYPAMFYSGGSGVQILSGAADFMRGLSGAAQFDDNPANRMNMVGGLQRLKYAAQSFIPLRSAVRDISRFNDAVLDGSMQESLAALLGTNVDRDVRMNDLIDSMNQLPQYPGAEEWMRYVPSQNGAPPSVVGGLDPNSGLVIPKAYKDKRPGLQSASMSRSVTVKGPVGLSGEIVAPPTPAGANQIPEVSTTGESKPIEY